MKLFDFLDIKYRSTALELQKQYSPFLDGRAKAAHSLIGLCRTLSKWLHAPIIMVEYLFILLKFKDAPKELEAPETKTTKPNLV